jgi:amino-acid N-acetyltransferase
MSDVEQGMSTPRIGGARRGDLEAIRWLLDVEFLPSADINETALEHFLVCRDEIGVVAGVVGLEIYGEVALLRSLVVTERHLGCGHGRRLVTAAQELANEMNVRAIYLLTTTAESFFEYLGYRRIQREEVPDAIRATREFASLCPASAIVMVKP